MSFGVIETAPCVNVPLPPDQRCSDPAFALANPSVCPATATLIIRPGVAMACNLGSIQFGAFYRDSSGEVDVTSKCTWLTSDPNIAVIGAASGNATGMGPGDAAITTSYNGVTASATLKVLAGDCCASKHSAFLVLLDTSLSMSQTFGSSYGTRLDFAKAAVAKFINGINPTKDTVGVIAFNGAQVIDVAPEGNDLASEVALMQAVSQSQQKTAFADAITAGIATLTASGADELVLLLVSDGEDTTGGTTNLDQAISALDEFKLQGGLVMCLGVRASRGFIFLDEFATGGFFVNALPSSVTAALDAIAGLKSYVCSGNCVPEGDVYVHTGQLDYAAFSNWDVIAGHVDLLGDGFLDLLPGNGLYVDMAGSSAPYKGQLQSKLAYTLVGGQTYRLSIKLAGNQRVDQTPESVRLRVVGASATLLDQTVGISDFRQGFNTYNFSFTPQSNDVAHLLIEQKETPNGDDSIGLLLASVTFANTTTLATLLSDDFSEENLTYVPPRCGVGTTSVWLTDHYGFATGTNCYAEGCLDSPLPLQTPDPSPLPDIEGSFTPPTVYTSTMQACVKCPAGFQNVAFTQAAASSPVSAAYDCSPTGLAGIDGVTAEIGQYAVTPGADPSVCPSSWALQGSNTPNDAASWVNIDTQAGITFTASTAQTFDMPVVGYSSYRLLVSSVPDCTKNQVAFTLSVLSIGPAASQQACQSATATSMVSKSDADAQANAAAQAAAQGLLNCLAFYTSTEQYTAQCSGGTYGQPITKSATASSYISQQTADAKALASATTAANALLTCNQSNNTQPIIIHDATAGGPSAATPYPSVKYVTGAPASIATLQVTLKGIVHPTPQDILILLQGPDGTNCVLMAHNWGGVGGDPATGQVLRVNNVSGGQMATNGSIQVFGEITAFAASHFNIDGELFPAPAPQTLPYGTDMDVFQGKNANGPWALWVMDDAHNSNGGQISFGWDITFT